MSGEACHPQPGKVRLSLPAKMPQMRKNTGWKEAGLAASRGILQASVVGECAHWGTAAPASAGTGALAPRDSWVLFLISHGSCLIPRLTLGFLLFSFQPPGPDNMLGPP